MYPKIVRVRSGSKNVKKIEYLRLIRKYRDKSGRQKEEIVANLGRVETIGEELGRLIKSLRKYTDEVLVTPEEIESRASKDYGAALVGQKLWREIGLDRWLQEVCGSPLPGSLGEPGVLAMVLNRLIEPCSKLSMYDWLPSVYLPGWQGEGFELPEKQDVFAERFYRTMDWLIKGKNKEKIEEEIGGWAMKLFPVDVVFYDITNIQFEGWEELKQARHGYIRLGKKNHKQILLGIVSVNGLPAASHIFRGNRAEKTTLLWVKDRLKKQFNIGRVVFVCDRGLISAGSLAEIESKGDGYIVALKRRRVKETEEILKQDISSFTPIKKDKKGKNVLYAWEAPEEEGKRRVVVYNPLKAREEKEKREEIITELGAELKALEERVKEGKVKAAKTIVTRCEKILSEKRGKRYFSYEVPGDGRFRYELNRKNLALEENLDGKFVVKTTVKNLSAEEVVFKYKELMEVEDSFRDLKDLIRVAPVHHWRYRRVKAHVFICVLALLLERYMKQKLEANGIEMSPRKALKQLRKIKVVENKVGHLHLKYVTPPDKELARLLSAFGIFKLPRMLDDVSKMRVKRKK